MTGTKQRQRKDGASKGARDGLATIDGQAGAVVAGGIGAATQARPQVYDSTTGDWQGGTASQGTPPVLQRWQSFPSTPAAVASSVFKYSRTLVIPIDRAEHAG